MGNMRRAYINNVNIFIRCQFFIRPICLLCIEFIRKFKCASRITRPNGSQPGIWNKLKVECKFL